MGAPSHGPTYLEFPHLGRVQVVDANDARFIYREIFEAREYLRHGLDLRPGDVVFDVGANIGLFSLFAYQECEGVLSLHAFEPVAPIYAALRANLERGTGGLESVRAHNCGLTSADGPSRALVTYYERQPGNSTTRPAEKEGQIQRRLTSIASRDRRQDALGRRRSRMLSDLRRRWVRWRIRRSYRSDQLWCRFVPLSKFLDESEVEQIDLLKIDVEGGEWEVLCGIRIDDWPRIRQVVMEAHDVDGRVNQIAGLLRERGFGEVVVEQPDFARAHRLDNFNIYARR
jgi:FkbM family methyltransferase